MRSWHVAAVALGVTVAAGVAALAVTGRGRPVAAQEEAAERDAPAESAWFEDVTEAAGLEFVHDAGPVDGKFFMPQTVGSGCAVFDADGDGLPDVYLLNNGGPKGRPNALFCRLPGKGLRFRDASRGSGLDFAGHCMGAAVGDVDNDGRLDLLVTLYGGVRLFRNAGGGRFEDVTRSAGLDNPAWGTSAAFFDYDGDGWLDLVVVNYVDYDPSWPCTAPNGSPDYCSPNVFPGSVTRLFRNLGGAGGGVRFEDVTLRAGLGRLPGPGLGVACADFDGDGRPDVFVANDGKPNRLWINRGGSAFEDEAVVRGVAYNGMGQAQAGMGVALGDADGDGLFDLFVTHLGAETNTLWVQGPRGLFRDRSGTSGLARPRWRGTGFGTVLADFDLDGAPDVAVANGRVARGPAAGDLGPHWSAYAERHQLFANAGGGRFRDRSAAEPALCNRPGVGRGLIAADLDGDGAPDLVLTTAGGRARLFRNVAPHRGHWLTVRVLDPALGRDAVGAEVAVAAGGRVWRQPVGGGGSYLCDCEPRARFGLGNAGRVDWFEVRWPGGRRERFPGGPADRVLVLRRGAGQPVRQ